MGLFDKIGDAQVGAGSVYFLAGKYTIEIVGVKMFQSRKREDLFIIEAKILESSNPERAVGTKASHIINMKHDAALGNIKGFLAACSGLDPDDKENVNKEITEDVAEEAVSSDNPLQGTHVNLECTNIKTREGGDFTLHRYSPM